MGAIMAKNPLASELKKEEKSCATAIKKLVDKALTAKDVQKKLDAATNSSTPRPPKPVLDIYQKVLAAQEKVISKSYAGLAVEITPKYKMNGASWNASAMVSVSYPLEKLGGATHKVAPGDTLWDIAEYYYGSGFYWTNIAEANPAQVTSKGNFILAGTTLKIPQLEIVAKNSCQPIVIKKAKAAPKPAKRKARPVAMPVVEVDLEKASSVKTMAKLPGMTVIYTLTLKGTLKAQKPGIIPASFNPRTNEVEISNGVKPFATSFVIKNNSIDSISVSNKITGTTWTSKVSMTKKGSFKVSFSNKFLKFKHKGIHYEGTVGLELEVEVIPDPKRAPRRVPVTDQIYEWFAQNQKVVGYTLLIGAGTIVVVTLAEDIVTLGAGIADDPVSFAAAGAMANRALVLIK